MEIIVALALIALFGAWWIIQSRAGGKSQEITDQRQATDHLPGVPTPRTDLPLEGLSARETEFIGHSTQSLPYAEIVDPNGGVRQISSDEVSAYFRPVQTKLASLRKVAVNSTRVSRAFAQSGGATPSAETYRRAHRDAVALTAETEGLLDIILFGAEADANGHDELLERVIDVEVELEESLGLIAKTEAQIASGNFLPVGSMRTAKLKAQSAEI